MGSASLFLLRTSCYRLLPTAIPACPLGAAAAATMSPVTVSHWPTGAIQSSLSMTKRWTPQRVTDTTSTNKATIQPSLLSCYGQEPVGCLPARLDLEMVLSPINCLTYASNNPRSTGTSLWRLDTTSCHSCESFPKEMERPVRSMCFLIFTGRRHAVHTFMFIRTYQCMDNLSKKRFYVNKKLLWKKYPGSIYVKLN